MVGHIKSEIYNITLDNGKDARQQKEEYSSDGTKGYCIRTLVKIKSYYVLLECYCVYDSKELYMSEMKAISSSIR
jgi:hypothetical protein